MCQSLPWWLVVVFVLSPFVFCLGLFLVIYNKPPTLRESAEISRLRGWGWFWRSEAFDQTEKKKEAMRGNVAAIAWQEGFERGTHSVFLDEHCRTSKLSRVKSPTAGCTTRATVLAGQRKS